MQTPVVWGALCLALASCLFESSRLCSQNLCVSGCLLDTTEWLFPLSGSSDWSGVRRLRVKTVSEFGLEDTSLPFFKFL